MEQLASFEVVVSDAFVDLRDKRAVLFNKKAEVVTPEMRMRADCELYEWVMQRDNIWKKGATWHVDGISDKYGKVDVKFIDKWWNLGQMKMWNLCRSYGKVDHWYFVEKIVWPDGPLLPGDKVEMGFIGVMNFEQIMKRVERSGYDKGGFYVDVRKHSIREHD